jgi:hypothetical protein
MGHARRPAMIAHHLGEHGLSFEHLSSPAIM